MSIVLDTTKVGHNGIMPRGSEISTCYNTHNSHTSYIMLASFPDIPQMAPQV